MYADHSLRLAQEIVTKNFFLRLLRQKGKGGGKLRMIQNGGLAAGGKKIFFKLLRLGKLDKLFTHQIIKGNFPFPPPAQLQDFIYGCVTNDYLAKGIECVLDMHLVGFIFGHGNSPSLNNSAGLSTTARSGVHFIVDWLGWVCYLPDKLEFILSYHVLPS
nr:hypothetical protein [Campylobacter coli]HDV6534872.1 hypothetical protein [Campylobacter coli]